MSKVVKFYEFGNPDVLKIEEEAPREPQSGEGWNISISDFSPALFIRSLRISGLRSIALGMPIATWNPMSNWGKSQSPFNPKKHRSAWLCKFTFPSILKIRSYSNVSTNRHVR
jgi:hypothetical protein